LTNFKKSTYLSQAKLEVDRTSPATQIIILKASNSDANIEKTVKALAVVCGEEKLTLVEENNDIFDIFERQVSETRLKFSFATLWKNVHPSSYINKINGCPIKKFMLCAKADCLEESNDSIIKIIGTDLEIDITKPISDAVIFLTPVTTGGVMHPLPIKLKVCGNEIVSPKSKDPIINLLPTPIIGQFKYEVDMLFDNSDPKCPLDYSL